MAVSGAGVTSGNQTMLRKLMIILEMIKFEHTIFALPFALISMLLASRNLPTVCLDGVRYMDNRRNGRGAKRGHGVQQDS